MISSDFNSTSFKSLFYNNRFGFTHGSEHVLKDCLSVDIEMSIVIEGFSSPELIRYLSGGHLCNACPKPIQLKCPRCEAVGYCSHKCRKADTAHTLGHEKSVCRSMKTTTQPFLKALFQHTIYALLHSEPENELFKLNEKYFYVEPWASDQPSLWKLTPMTQHQFCSSVSVAVIRATKDAKKVFCSPQIGVVYLDN